MMRDHHKFTFLLRFLFYYNRFYAEHLASEITVQRYRKINNNNFFGDELHKANLREVSHNFFSLSYVRKQDIT